MLKPETYTHIDSSVFLIISHTKPSYQSYSEHISNPFIALQSSTTILGHIVLI